MHELGCPCNASGGWGHYATCQCDQIRLRANTAALEEHTEMMRQCDNDKDAELSHLRAELARVTAERDEARAAMIVPASWYCPVCDFVCLKSIIHPGGISDDNRETDEYCPNCPDVQLKRETWKKRSDDARQAFDRQQQIITDLQSKLTEAERLNAVHANEAMSHAVTASLAHALASNCICSLDDKEQEHLARQILARVEMIACPRCMPPGDPCCPYCDGTYGVPRNTYGSEADHA